MKFRFIGGEMLRRGYSTGSCAAAAAKAATTMLLRQTPCQAVTLVTPSGITLRLKVLDIKLLPGVFPVPSKR